MDFDWDPEKAADNLVKHGVSFDQAIKVFDDPDAKYFPDDEHSREEIREKVIGSAEEAGIVLVVFTERKGDILRIISAWKATKREKKLYEKY
ncbi:MAG: BrnT family toxin [Elusimicrobia bacterium]|nr:BrnT family toxin [Elusimicrobiota bacterium]